MADDRRELGAPHALTCSVHPGVPAIGQCAHCGTPLCARCVRAGDRRGTVMCPDCLAADRARPTADRAATPRDRRKTWRVLAIVASFAIAAGGLAYVFRGAWSSAAVEGEASGFADRLRRGAEVERMRHEAAEAISRTEAVARSDDFPTVAEQVMQSVVRISAGGGMVEARGSGFIVSSDGDILTAAHVIEGSSEPLVSFVDGREQRATVLVRDEHLDVALLHVDGTNLPALYMGTSGNLPIGTEVAVLGYPLNFSMERMGLRGLTPTLVQGIIAARQTVRPTSLSQPISILQIDANLNPGHSGGPVFIRSTGEVVGITNAAIETMFGGNTDICFAVPIDVARDAIGR